MSAIIQMHGRYSDGEGHEDVEIPSTSHYKRPVKVTDPRTFIQDSSISFTARPPSPTETLETLRAPFQSTLDEACAAYVLGDCIAILNKLGSASPRRVSFCFHSCNALAALILLQARLPSIRSRHLLVQAEDTKSVVVVAIAAKSDHAVSSIGLSNFVAFH